MTSRFHRMWGVTVFQKNFCIFSVFKAKPDEWWLYIRHKVEDCPYLIGKMTHDGIQESENMPYPVYCSWKGEKKGQFYFLGSMLQEHKLLFYKKVSVLWSMDNGVVTCYYGMMPVHPHTRIDMIKKVKKLRQKQVKGKDMSYRMIDKKLMEDGDTKTSNLERIWRWANFDESKLSTD